MEIILFVSVGLQAEESCEVTLSPVANNLGHALNGVSFPVRVLEHPEEKEDKTRNSEAREENIPENSKSDGLEAFGVTDDLHKLKVGAESLLMDNQACGGPLWVFRTIGGIFAASVLRLGLGHDGKEPARKQ